MGGISCFICILEAWWTTDKEYHTHGRSFKNCSVLTVPVPVPVDNVCSGRNPSKSNFNDLKFRILILFCNCIMGALKKQRNLPLASYDHIRLRLIFHATLLTCHLTSHFLSHLCGPKYSQEFSNCWCPEKTHFYYNNQ
jgi:hypothetical protein